MDSILNKIEKENDIKKLEPSEYKQLAREIRRKLVRTVGKTGGHLASNLGAVELTMALHLFMDFPKDKLVWDVGHQSYVHKILTGRADSISTLRQMGGISGFPKTQESPCDAFNTGHSSTSISAALGFAKARDLKNTNEKVVAVIGDGALTGGMAYEALNNSEPLKTDIMIVLNDNKMSISKNVGGVSKFLERARTNKKYTELKMNIEEALDKIPNVGSNMAGSIKNAKNSLKHLLVHGMYFEEMGIIYLGPVDGHNIPAMLSAFEAASRIKNRPVLVHVITKKGKGYSYAEENPSKFHGIDPFDVKTGETYSVSEIKYTDAFSKWLLYAGTAHKDVVSVCAAMPDGTGVTPFKKKYPNRSFDVGIAEEHAVTFAAGLASGGLKPVVSIYSTFLQRAYDQIIHDVAINKLPVIFAVDRSGIVGRDGDTHQGIFDISYLTSVPGMEVLSPASGDALWECFEYAYKHDGPVAIRYPRRHAKIEKYAGDGARNCHVDEIRSELIREGSQVIMLAVGDMVTEAVKAAKVLEEKGISAAVADVRRIKPIDEKFLRENIKEDMMVVTMEDGVRNGGFGDSVLEYMVDNDIKYKGYMNISIEDEFVTHGSIKELFEKYGMDGQSVANRIYAAIEPKE